MKYKIQKLPMLENVHAIYFTGIKGVGMTPLAIIASDARLKVGGSDLNEEFITDKSLKEAKIAVDKGFEEKSISNFFEGVDVPESLVVTTGAHKGFDNPQVIWAKEKGINVITQGQALSLFMEGEVLGRDGFDGIAVAGSHGKTTISSMLAVVLDSLGLEPTYAVGTGGIVPLGSPGGFGKGRFFVAEADEYASEPVYDRVPKFLYLKPKYAIFNNIDFDHPDMFESIEDIEVAFLELAHNIKSGGLLFVNGDDQRLKFFKDKVNKDIRIVTYGQKIDNDYCVSKIHLTGFESRFTVSKKNREVGFFELSIPGEHNVKNALSVIAFLSELGYDASKIRNGLKKFEGSNRRLEKVGSTKDGALIIDDYGHHPEEIQTTIRTLRSALPDKKIIVIFQPHTFSRTKALLTEFSTSFEGVEKLVLLPIFRSQRDTENDTIENSVYIDAFRQDSNVEYKESFESVVEYLNQNYSTNEYVILTIGAGDVYKIGYKLKQ